MSGDFNLSSRHIGRLFGIKWICYAPWYEHIQLDTSLSIFFFTLLSLLQFTLILFAHHGRRRRCWSWHGIHTWRSARLLIHFVLWYTRRRQIPKWFCLRSRDGWAGGGGISGEWFHIRRWWLIEWIHDWFTLIWFWNILKEKSALALHTSHGIFGSNYCVWPRFNTKIYVYNEPNPFYIIYHNILSHADFGIKYWYKYLNAFRAQRGRWLNTR